MSGRQAVDLALELEEAVVVVRQRLLLLLKGELQVADLAGQRFDLRGLLLRRCFEIGLLAGQCSHLLVVGGKLGFVFLFLALAAMNRSRRAAGQRSQAHCPHGRPTFFVLARFLILRREPLQRDGSGVDLLFEVIQLGLACIKLLLQVGHGRVQCLDLAVEVGDGLFLLQNLGFQRSLFSSQTIGLGGQLGELRFLGRFFLRKGADTGCQSADAQQLLRGASFLNSAVVSYCGFRVNCGVAFSRGLLVSRSFAISRQPRPAPRRQ